MRFMALKNNASFFDGQIIQWIFLFYQDMYEDVLMIFQVFFNLPLDAQVHV